MQYEVTSKRLIPEVLNFLSNAILLLAPHNFSESTLPGGFPAPDVLRKDLADLKLTASATTPSSLDIVTGLTQSDLDAADDTTSASLLLAAIQLLSRFSQLYVSLESFAQIAEPILAILDGIDISNMHDQLQTSHASLTRDLKRMQSVNKRKPLRLQHQKPIPIPSLVPKFDDGFKPGKAFDPDTVRAEEAKMKALYRKEKKGAIRELRKDNRFIASEQAKLRTAKDDAYKSKIGRIRSDLQAERSEEKQYDRTKKKLRANDKKRSQGSTGKRK